MALPPPVVRHMLLCDDILTDPTNRLKLGLVGFINRVTPPPGAGYPFRLPKLCVFLELSNGRGSGEAWVDAVEADTGRIVFASPRIRIAFQRGVLAVSAAVFRLKDCPIPRPGLYWVRFLYDNHVLAEQDFLARSSPDVDG